MILGKDSRKPWDKWDLLLGEAYQILEDERCPQCGLPRYICDNESNEIQFRTHRDSCSAKQAIERREAKDAKDKLDTSGTVLRPEPYSTTGAELVDYREPYYRSLAEQRAKLAELNAS